jgi:eukaryotic-like serine/threonine-protein kinase
LELRTQLARVDTPRPSRFSLGEISGYGALPPDVVEKAIVRLGWLALFYAIAFPILRLLEGTRMPWSQVFPFPYFLADLAIAGAMMSGGTICALAFSKKLRPSLMLDLGLIFEVIGALWIGLAEYGGRPLADMPFRGFSGICVWIIYFVLVIPETLGKTLLATFATVLMGPLGLLIATLVYDRPLPAAPEWMLLFFPSVLIAIYSVVLSRFIYSMGLEMRHAREMGSYKLIEKIGEGGMGEVWRAEHRMLARPSALKVVKSEICGKSDAQTGTLNRRFEREVRATAGLHSPHTVAVYDYGNSESGCFYYVMELLNGFDLDTLVKRYGPQPAERVIQFLLQACDSLAEAHLNDLVHRDIKPKNLFTCRLGLNYDFVKVLDFGLVKSGAIMSEVSQDQLTMAGTTTGTPAYMAPEMALGKAEIDARADIYSLGCVGYWLLTGHLVFEYSGTVPILLAHIQEEPIPPSERSELDIPSDLERVILACLEKEPARRPQTALELAELLSACSIPKRWTPQRAEAWWRTHVPSLTANVPGTISAPAKV